MAYASSDLRLPADGVLLPSTPGALASFGGSIATFIRRRRIYHRTLAELQGYTERSLHDIGADQGIEEFARRAARL